MLHSEDPEATRQAVSAHPRLQDRGDLLAIDYRQDALQKGDEYFLFLTREQYKLYSGP
jgi:hypothetical protein